MPSENSHAADTTLPATVVNKGAAATAAVSSCTKDDAVDTKSVSMISILKLYFEKNEIINNHVKWQYVP